MKNKPVFISIIILLIFFTALVARSSTIMLINIFFIIYLIAGILQMPVKEKIKIKAERFCSKTKMSEYFLIDVHVNIVNRGKGKICIFCEDPLRRDMKIISGSLKHHAVIYPGVKTDLKYSFMSSRGVYKWDNFKVTVCDPFKCFKAETDLEAPGEVFIQPQFNRFRPFNSHPWKTLSSPGIIRTRMSGNSTDFYGVREYRPGDPLRTLHWKLTARYPHKFFTREFVQERTADIAIVIDGRKSMDSYSGTESIFELEVKLAASLAEMFICQGHRVGMSVAGENFRHVLPGYGKKQLHRILNCLASAKTGNDGPDDVLFNLPLKQFSSKTQIFFLSPFDYNDISYYRNLRFYGFQIVLICPDIFDFAFPEKEKKDKDNMALRLSRLERKLYLDLVSQLSISVINWKVNEPVQPLLKNKLIRPARIKKL